MIRAERWNRARGCDSASPAASKVTGTWEDILGTPQSWDAVYAPDAAPPPRDIGRPQPAFLRLADRGLLSGRLLDAGPFLVAGQ
jgi:hypothetical protein